MGHGLATDHGEAHTAPRPPTRPCGIRGSADESAAAAELVRRTRAGDAIAFTELYTHFFDRVYRYLLVALKNPDDAQEVSQDVFVRFLSLRERYEPARGEFRAWLFSMVRGLAIDHQRKGSRSTTMAPSDMPSDSRASPLRLGTLLERLDPGSGVRTLIETLPDAQRRAVALRFVFELSATQIADILGSTPQAVRQLQHRALKSLTARAQVPAAGRRAAGPAKLSASPGREGRSASRRPARAAPLA